MDSTSDLTIIDTRLGENEATMRIYLDNMLDSARSLGNLGNQTEREAFSRLLANHFGKHEVVTSRESWREQERTKETTKREALKQNRGTLPTVAVDHQVVGFHHQVDQYGGGGSTPLVSDIIDESAYSALLSTGMKDADARHVMYAAVNRCEIFLTDDGGIHKCSSRPNWPYRSMRVLRPSELEAELTMLGP